MGRPPLLQFLYSDNPRDYTIGLPIGYGASSIVYAARWLPKDGSPALPCAVKVADLDKLPPASLRLLRRETQLMSLSKHPNVLRVRGSWVEGHSLYIALRLMNAGSAADVMRYGWPGGMEEEVVKCILKQALEGLKCVPDLHRSSGVELTPYYLITVTSISMALSIETLRQLTCLLTMMAPCFWATSVSPLPFATRSRFQYHPDPARS